MGTRTITILPPMIITPRLMAGVQIGTGAGAAWISVGDDGRNGEGRTCYGAYIDYPDAAGVMQEYEVTDLRSGCQGGDEREGLASLLSFLGAAAESLQYREYCERKNKPNNPDDSNEHLFPPAVVQWAAENADEIGMLQYEIEEGAR